ncbi:sensor histidine kinase [Caulobacter sp. RL271]|jgi:signal transduction histidine kinase/ligand-binding sensor domain-containing protein|uniref:Histidine kinase n=1 Tax=Caulobacter segnis TaxID=88688 RepID=A0ABY4ZMU3_9CAUL|nr:sensor histidine kinase [Caulobacter segnis]USQ93898.1 histidine kinase [Caulobacter segnis]
MVSGFARIGCAALLAAAFLAGPAWALDPQRAIGQYKHTRWTVEDGAPSSVEVIAQTADGYLWLGTPLGLYRFDGMTFEPMRPPRPAYSMADRVVSLMVTRSGALWAGYESGGIAVYEHGRFRLVYDPKIFRAVTIRMAEGRDGTIWAATTNPKVHLARFAKGAWRPVDDITGLPDQDLSDILVARDGTVWVATDHHVARLSPGEARFKVIRSDLAEGIGLAQDGQGRIWASDARGTRVIDGAAAELPYPSRSRITRILIDRDQNLWGAQHPDGVFRIRTAQAGRSNSPGPETFSVAQGLSSAMAYAVFEDRESNIWVATIRGLDRFRPASLVSEPVVPASSPYGYVVFADARGVVYVSDSTTLYRALPGGPLKPFVRDLGPVSTMCDAADGGLWVGLGDRFVHIADGKLRPAPRPNFPNLYASACVHDAHGALWAAGFMAGLLRYDGREWTASLPKPLGLAITALASDWRGRIVADGGRGAVLIDGPDVRTITTPPRPMRGGTMPMADGPLGVLSGSDRGLTRFQDDRTQFISRDRFPFIGFSHGMAQTDRETWLLGAAGLVRMQNADLERAFQDPRAPLPARIFDLKDGLPGPASYKYRSDLAVGGDGRIWIATTTGIAWLDPARLPVNTVPPPVTIRSIVVDGVRTDGPTSLVLPRGAKTVEIDYAALSLAIPERVRFRYRLEGVDTDWVEAGARRQAFYTNLKPGKYVFRVRAANNDGVWNEQGASLTLELPPTLFQSRLFLLLCAGVAAGLLTGAYHWRMRNMSERLQAGLRERMAERERIARELHDTLLQGVQGLILKFQSATRQVPPELPARDQLERALDRAEDVVVEARDRVRSLRSGAAGDLVATLTEVAETMRSPGSTETVVMAQGRAADLHPLVADEIERVVIEALFNAHRHARATKIDVVVAFEPRRLRVSVHDDGVGVEPAILEAGGREGHFGLAGMRERARKIRGTLTIRSAPGRGTEVELVAPANVAYATRPAARWAWLRPWSAGQEAKR